MHAMQFVSRSSMHMIRRALLVILKRRRILLLLIGLILFFFWITLRNSIESMQCSDKQSMLFLDELCTNYSHGIVTGSLCAPLCVRKEIEFSRCLGHGVKAHVLSAAWRGAKIVLKTASSPHMIETEYVLGSLNLPEMAEQESSSIATDKFIKQVCDTMYYDLAKVNLDSVTRMVKQVATECDMGADGILYIDELLSCCRLLETKEYSFFQLLRGNSAFPRVLGVCGGIYAVEYAPSEPFLGFLTAWSEVRDWRFRAQLAIALLEMVESLENTEFGTIYLCDLQESNFGVMRRADGFVVKAIDMDISFFEHSLQNIALSEQNNSCFSDEDCNFISCSIKCNTRTKRCAGVLSSNNLRGICVRLFKQLHAHHPALLMNPPRAIADQLNKLLTLCVETETPHVVMHLLKQLQAVLISSLVF